MLGSLGMTDKGIYGETINSSQIKKPNNNSLPFTGDKTQNNQITGGKGGRKP
jgi:hypothetical protein